jgi:hypothetical protein
MTSGELLPLMAQYRAGLEAEMALLHRLELLSARQRELSEDGDIDALPPIVDQRDSVMASLVRIEHELKPVRLALAEHRTELTDTEDFRDLMALHREAATLVAAVMTSDQASVDALKEAELARRLAARALEQGESTLAAYRRVVTPRQAGATLVNRKG